MTPRDAKERKLSTANKIKSAPLVTKYGSMDAIRRLCVMGFTLATSMAERHCEVGQATRFWIGWLLDLSNRIEFGLGLMVVLSIEIG